MSEVRRKTMAEIREEIAEDNRKAAELLTTLEIPEYAGRSIQADLVKSISGRAISGLYSGLTALAPQEVADMLKAGDPYVLETKNFSRITGWLINGKWYDRRSDQELKREHEMFVADMEDKNKKYTEEHREEWTRRESELPDWLKKQMEFQRSNNPHFESKSMGWSYALITCELASMYVKMGDILLTTHSSDLEDTEEIKKFSEENGTSGNQHQLAIYLAKNQLRTGENR